MVIQDKSNMGSAKASETSPNRWTSGRSGEGWLLSLPDPLDGWQVGRGPHPEERPPDPLDVPQVGRASQIGQIQVPLTANPSVQADLGGSGGVARPAGRPAGRVGPHWTSGRAGGARPGGEVGKGSKNA